MSGKQWSGMLLLGGLLLGLLLWWSLFLRGYGRVDLATGQSGGTYRTLGEGLAKFVAAGDSRFAVEVLPSQGTGQNLRLLEEEDADFAIVQSGQGHQEGVRVVAKLYTEALHILVPEDRPQRKFGDFVRRARVAQSGGATLRFCLGEEGSGSRLVAKQLLAHFGVSGFEEVNLAPAEALAALQNEELDAVFLVTALQSDVLRQALAGGGVDFLNLETERAGLVARFPHLVPTAIPAMTYHCAVRPSGAMPSQAVATVGVNSFLVCRSKLSAEVVFEMTKQLFASRSKLSEIAPEAYQIAEIGATEVLPWPVHEGAQRYYRRREPGFLERYAEVMAFLMSLAAASWAVWGTVSKWSSRKKKNRIDDYYLEVAAAFIRLEEDDLSLESLAQERARLRKLRGGAFQDLAAERLKADDSFEIFQNQVALCLDDVRRREERLR